MKRWAASFFTVLFLLSVIACGEEHGKEVAGPAPGSAPASAPPRAERPETVFRFLTEEPINSIDPHYAELKAERHISGALFEGLVTPSPLDGSPVPGMAEAWEVSDDGDVYTFFLRPAKWSDGISITADTVVKSWVRLFNPRTGSPHAKWAASFIKGAEAFNSGTAGPEALGVKAVDDSIVRVELTGAVPYFLDVLTHVAFSLLPIHKIAAYGDAWTSPEHVSCNGAFILADKTGEYTLEKNDTYRDGESVAIDKIAVDSQVREEGSVKAYLEGEADWLLEVSVSAVPEEYKKDIHKHPLLGTYFYIFQTEKPPFTDVRVRKALALAIDTSTLGGVPAGGFVPPLPNYAGVAAAVYDIEAAREYLASAGFPGGAGFPNFEIMFNSTEENRRVGRELQRQWKKHLGIFCTLKEEEWVPYLALRRAGAFQLVRAGWKSDIQDPLPFLSIFKTGNEFNCGRYSNARFDEFFDKAVGKGDPIERLEYFKKAEEVLLRETQGILPLYHYAGYNLIDLEKWDGWHPNVKDYHPLKAIKPAGEGLQ